MKRGKKQKQQQKKFINMYYECEWFLQASLLPEMAKLKFENIFTDVAWNDPNIKVNIVCIKLNFRLVEKWTVIFLFLFSYLNYKC